VSNKRSWFLLTLFVVACATLVLLQDDRSSAQETGTLIIDKRTLPDGADDGFLITTDPITGCYHRLIRDDGSTLECRFAGTAQVTEEEATNYKLTDVICDDGTEFDPGINGVTVSLNPDDVVHCTFENTKVPPSIEVSKTADPSVVAETGGSVTFIYSVTNTSAQSVEVTSLFDDKFGLLTGDTDCQVGTRLSSGQSCMFELTKTLSGDFPDVHKNTFTAMVADDQGNVADASASATVTFADALPTIDVTKSANPNSVLFTGGAIAYLITVKNTGLEPVTVSSLMDSKFGDLTGIATCKRSSGTVVTLPFTLSASETVTCTFTKNLSGEMNSNGLGFKPHTNTVTGTAFDDEGNRTTDSASATVSFFWRGRTPGYWKNHAQPSTWPPPYTPTTKLSSVFTLPQGMCGGKLATKFASDTLVKALAYKGGSDLNGRAETLLRAAVAAVLNEQYFGALYPAYNTTSELIAAVNQTLATCVGAKYIALANQLDFWNNGVH
jgi:hypothetical protein